MRLTANTAVVSVPKEYGCVFKRQAKDDDREMWYSPITGKHFPVDRGCNSRHTANGIMKRAGTARKSLRTRARNSGDDLQVPAAGTSLPLRPTAGGFVSGAGL